MWLVDAWCDYDRTVNRSDGDDRLFCFDQCQRVATVPFAVPAPAGGIRRSAMLVYPGPFSKWSSRVAFNVDGTLLLGFGMIVVTVRSDFDPFGLQERPSDLSESGRSFRQSC
jgi:hypothetical protein